MIKELQEKEATTMAPKVYVETYGCQMNISDGELMNGILASEGYELTNNVESADVILVNTCAIREHAERRVIGRVSSLNKLKLEKPELVIGVTGCMAQRLGEELLEQAPYIDLVMGPDGYRKLPNVLEAVRPNLAKALKDRRLHKRNEEKGRPAKTVKNSGKSLPLHPAMSNKAVGPKATLSKSSSLPVIGSTTGQGMDEVLIRGQLDVGDQGPRFALTEMEAHENYEGLEVKRNNKVSAWVPVQRGCNYRCTYCIVPYVRGSEKNRNPEHIIQEVREIAEQGTREVTLLGQTVNSYQYEDWNFPRLLKAVARIDGIKRVRFTSPHPNDVTSELVQVMAEEEAVCKHIHLPLQSGSNQMLKRMVRRYTVERFKEIVTELRAAMPGIEISTDVIVAFPGETEEDFQETLEIMREVRFSEAYMYKFSPRAGTPATRFPEADFIPDEVGSKRLQDLIDMQRSIQAEISESQVGSVEEVLVEGPAKSEGDLLGRTEGNKVVAFSGANEEAVGSFVRVELQSTTGATFKGCKRD